MKDYYNHVDVHTLKETAYEFNMILEKIRSEKEKGTYPNSSEVRNWQRNSQEMIRLC